MRLLSSIVVLIILVSAVAAAPRGDDPPASSQAEKTVAAARDVYVELSHLSGDVLVRGWDREEVRARSADAQRVELRQYESETGGAAADKKTPARRVEVFILNTEEEEAVPGEHNGSGDVELNVPRGATVHVKLQSGDVEIADVSEVRVESMSGDVDVSGASKGVEVTAFSGDVTASDSNGSVRLRSQSGTVEARNVRPNDDRDTFVVKSVSGNINLDRVSHAKVEGETTSGNVHFAGPLAARGGYTLQTWSGDVTMALPADASFRVVAKVIMGGQVLTDFAVKTDPRAPKNGRQFLDGTVGNGDAEITLTSFNGTVHLRRK